MGDIEAVSAGGGPSCAVGVTRGGASLGMTHLGLCWCSVELDGRAVLFVVGLLPPKHGNGP